MADPALNPPAKGEYRCEMCGGVFSYGWSDDEAKAEANANGFDVANCGVVCDDCYKLTPWGRGDG